MIARECITMTTYDSDRLGRYMNMGSVDAVFAQLFRNEVVDGDVHLFFLRVSRNFDELHSIEKRRRYARHVVGCRDEKHARKIEWHIQIAARKLLQREIIKRPRNLLLQSVRNVTVKLGALLMLASILLLTNRKEIK